MNPNRFSDVSKLIRFSFATEGIDSGGVALSGGHYSVLVRGSSSCVAKWMPSGHVSGWDGLNRAFLIMPKGRFRQMSPYQGNMPASGYQGPAYF